MKKNILTSSFSLLASVALMLTAMFGGTALASEDLDLTPFTRVAAIGPILDPVEANDVARAVASAIATYVATEDDTQPPTEFDENWVLGGLEGEPTEEAIEEAILRIPTPYRIDPTAAMSASNRKKVNVVEMCNPLFAKKALGVLPMAPYAPS